CNQFTDARGPPINQASQTEGTAVEAVPLAWGAHGAAGGFWSRSCEGFETPALHPDLATPDARTHAVSVLAGCWLLVGETLAVATFDEQACPHSVADFAVLISERELVAVAIQVAASDMVI